MRLLPFALLLAVSAPAAAQPALTVEEELHCGIIVAAAAGQASDPTAKQGLASIVSYFFGRYEGRTGRGFEQSGNAETVLKAMASAPTLAPRCQAAALSMGNRMQVWGKALVGSVPKTTDGKK